MRADLLIHIELLIGSIGVVLGLFFSSFILFTRAQQTRANQFLAIYLLAFSLRIGKSLFHNYFDVEATVRTVFLTILLCVGPSVWLYTTYLVKNPRYLNRKYYLHYSPFIVGLGFAWLIPNDGSSWIFGVFYDFLTIHMFGYTIMTIWWTSRSENAALLSQRPEFKSWLKFFLTVNLILILVYFLISKEIIPFYLGLSFLFSLVVILFSFWILKNPVLFKVPVDKYKDSSLDTHEASRIVQALKTHMAESKPYLNASLNLTELGNQLGVGAKDLSQAINQIESLNYSQLISRYRVEEVKYLMAQSTHDHFSIAAIAFECGFSSISTFNAAFKKHAGVTAKEYRETIKRS